MSSNSLDTRFLHTLDTRFLNTISSYSWYKISSYTWYKISSNIHDDAPFQSGCVERSSFGYLEGSSPYLTLRQERVILMAKPSSRIATRWSRSSLSKPIATSPIPWVRTQIASLTSLGLLGQLCWATSTSSLVRRTTKPHPWCGRPGVSQLLNRAPKSNPPKI